MTRLAWFLVSEMLLLCVCCSDAVSVRGADTASRSDTSVDAFDFKGGSTDASERTERSRYRESYDIAHPALRRAARSTALVVDEDAVVEAPDGQYRLKGPTLGASRGLCPEEPFRPQPAPGFCSGFLVGPRHLVTAGHCIRNKPECAATEFVFGFHLRNDGANPRAVPSDAVYECSRIERRRRSETRDWTVVVLDRPVRGRPALPVRRGGEPADDVPVALVGHPAGLPSKVATGRGWVDPEDPELLRYDIGTWKGSSGSPVVNAASGLVEAVHVRGDGAFVEPDGRSCKIARSCPPAAPDSPCQLDEGIRTTAFASKIGPQMHDSWYQFPGTDIETPPGTAARQFSIPDVGPVGDIVFESFLEAGEHSTLRVTATRHVSDRGGERNDAIEFVSPGFEHLKTRVQNFDGRNPRGLWRVELETLDGSPIRLVRGALRMKSRSAD